ncbi:MAG: hypothetical protein ACK5L2_17995, partial [Planctomyces sp.]
TPSSSDTTTARTNDRGTAPGIPTRNHLAIQTLQNYPPNNFENSDNTNNMLRPENASQRCRSGGEGRIGGHEKF